MNLAESEENFPANCTLSASILDRVQRIKQDLTEDISRSDPAWSLLFGKRTESTEDTEESEEDVQDVPMDDDPAESQFPSTQFYFTQAERPCSKGTWEFTEKFDRIESLCEGLERSNGKLDFPQLDTVPEEELPELASSLEKKLTATGLYNLLTSLARATREEMFKYSEVFCTRVLLPKIIELDEPSRLLCSAVSECTEKFPDEIHRLVFIPLLNVELKDTTAVNAIVNGFNSQRNSLLVAEYFQYAKELRHWHIPMLQTLLSSKTDNATKEKCVRLFLDKAARYAGDKGFGKLVLSFIKVNGSFSEEQMAKLREIADIHETLFKKLMENMLNKM